MQINSLRIANWRQFREIDIEFHPRMTVITGPNGAGKTTVLNMISRTMGWNVALLAVPPDQVRDIEDEIGEDSLFSHFVSSPSGFVVTSDNQKVDLGLQNARNISQVYSAIGSTRGVYITSHRQQFVYSPISSIPLKVDALDVMLSQYTNRYRSSYSRQNQQEILKAEDSPTYRIKSCLISMAVFGEGNSKVSPDPAALAAFSGFEAILKIVLPQEIGFQKLHIKMPELLLVGGNGVFPIEALSGGAAAIVDLAWQLFLASSIYEDFIVMIDEPENHLHPSLQKRLLPSLMAAFPNAQFIVATHSPLMINSVEESKVYVVGRFDSHLFSSRLLDLINKASSSGEILYDVLGVDGSVPAWAEERFLSIIQSYEGRGDDASALRAMARELRDAGMAERIASAFEKVSRSVDDTAQEG